MEDYVKKELKDFNTWLSSQVGLPPPEPAPMVPEEAGTMVPLHEASRVTAPDDPVLKEIDNEFPRH
ncbi:hypothetical protein KC845_02710 [Candidatus Kaiserbacteria bacterium]|nr:hypothetical protein [Candidatus Kaiserbacteria bacterium]